MWIVKLWELCNWLLLSVLIIIDIILFYINVLYYIVDVEVL